MTDKERLEKIGQRKKSKIIVGYTNGIMKEIIAPRNFVRALHEKFKNGEVPYNCILTIDFGSQVHEVNNINMLNVNEFYYVDVDDNYGMGTI